MNIKEVMELKAELESQLLSQIQSAKAEFESRTGLQVDHFEFETASVPVVGSRTPKLVVLGLKLRVTL